MISVRYLVMGHKRVYASGFPLVWRNCTQIIQCVCALSNVGVIL
jgi:hypothetical protein